MRAAESSVGFVYAMTIPMCWAAAQPGSWKASYPKGARARLWSFVAGATPLVTNVWQPSPSLAVAEPGGRGRTDGRNVIPDGHVKHQPTYLLKATRCAIMRCDARRCEALSLRSKSSFAGNNKEW
jgi:hypothetical protein